MATTATVFGYLMTALGALLYGAAWYRHMYEDTPGHPSPTALIPAAFGIALVVLGVIAARSSAERTRMHVMHAAATVGLVGLVSSLVILGIRLAQGRDWNLAMTGMAALALLCAAFLILCVNSFMQVRRARKQREQTQPPSAV